MYLFYFTVLAANATFSSYSWPILLDQPIGIIGENIYLNSCPGSNGVRIDYGYCFSIL